MVFIVVVGIKVSVRKCFFKRVPIGLMEVKAGGGGSEDGVGGNIDKNRKMVRAGNWTWV